MRVIIHSDAARARACFQRANRAGEFDIEVRPALDYRKSLRNAREEIVVYVDVQSFAKAERTRMLKAISAHNGTLVGIIDPKASIDDVAELFHVGAFDYIGKTMWKDGISLKRLRSAVDAFSSDWEEDTEDEVDGVEVAAAGLIAADGWKQIASGKEYTFCLMFFELDLNDDWKMKAGRQHLDKVTALLESFIQRSVGTINGQIWMWSEYGGVVLFPFDGKTCDAVLANYRMALNRTIISAEEFDFDTLLSYRIALHIGNTVYKPRGKTGTIISNAVNFIFHLGREFAEPGAFYITSSVLPFVPKGLESDFFDSGVFEGQRIFRMRKRLT